VAILCLDASLARCGAALVEGGAVLAEAEADGGQGQAAAIALFAARVRDASSGGAPAAIAATIGPGGFTGIRAALSLAHGLAAGFGVPLVAVTTAEALALPRLGAAPVAVLIDSRRGHRFVQVFDAVGGLPLPRGPARAVAAEAVGSAIPPGAVTVGDAPEASLAALPRARDLAPVAAARLAGRLPPLAPLPLYLDAPAALPASGLRPAPVP
jgi:tRNA threonylcarbamoyladenosine biosynthesis protein TsaB